MQQLPDFFSFKNLTMRRFKLTDTPVVEALVNQAFDYQVPIVGRPRTDPSRLKTLSDESDFYVVEDGRAIVATIYTEPNDQSVHFGMFAIAPKYRGSGLAQAMLSTVEQYAKATGAKTVDLDYTSFSPWLKDYYQRYGFIETGVRETWINNAELVHMQKAID